MCNYEYKLPMGITFLSIFLTVVITSACTPMVHRTHSLFFIFYIYIVFLVWHDPQRRFHGTLWPWMRCNGTGWSCCFCNSCGCYSSLRCIFSLLCFLSSIFLFFIFYFLFSVFCFVALSIHTPNRRALFNVNHLHANRIKIQIYLRNLWHNENFILNNQFRASYLI